MAVNPELMAAFEISRSILLPDTAKVETFMKGKVENGRIHCQRKKPSGRSIAC